MALLVRKITKAQEFTDPSSDIHLYIWKAKGGLSLSNHIFLPYNGFKDITLQQAQESTWHKNYILHESGHSMQSRWLGPFYLIVIGAPSLIWAGCFKKWRQKTGTSYYWFFTEAWADKINNVKREG